MREADLVAAFARIVAEPQRPIVVGIGDDAAVWQPSRAHLGVITTDALVENVHFRSTMDARDIGARAMASNVSDIAAMGARSVLATVALGVPTDWNADRLCALYEGLQSVAGEVGCAIVGGDLTRSEVLSIAVTVVGEVRRSNLKRRDGARAGDVLAVTAPLGAARAGLLVNEGTVALAEPFAAQALSAHRRPSAAWREGLWLGASANVTAMMDVSDGLSTDVARMMSASSASALLDADVPVAPCAWAAALATGSDARTFALAGGEDFCLLAAIKGTAFAYLAERFRKRFGRPLLRIGVVRAGSGVAIREGDAAVALEAIGWDHFRETERTRA